MVELLDHIVEILLRFCLLFFIHLPSYLTVKNKVEASFGFYQPFWHWSCLS